jgi:hypothetical protein
MENEYTCDTLIMSRGTTRGGGWMLELSWMLPGSNYPLKIYGQNEDHIDGIQVNKRYSLKIKKGNLKKDRDGNEHTGEYPSHFFWDLQPPQLDTGPPEDFTGKPLPGEVDPPGIGSQARPDDIQTRIQVGQATNIAANWIASVSSYSDEYPMEALRLLRDKIYHEVLLVPVAAPQEPLEPQEEAPKEEEQEAPDDKFETGFI